MATVREYNQKLAVLKNTHKLTHTMKIASANKLRLAQSAQTVAMAYDNRLAASARMLPAGDNPHPLETARGTKKAALAIVVGTDRGLCGEFNNILGRKISEWSRDMAARGINVKFSLVGRRARAFFKDQACILKSVDSAPTAPPFGVARQAGFDARSGFLSGKYDEVYAIYNKFKSGVSFEPVAEQILPMESSTDRMGEPLLEPSANDARNVLYPLLLNSKLFAAMLSSAVSEHAARMLAMDNATKNVEDLLETQTLLRNKARQSAITKELIEIVAGAEALR